jgi:hypothetical protein
MIVPSECFFDEWRVSMYVAIRVKNKEGRIRKEEGRRTKGSRGAMRAAQDRL